MSQGRAGEGIRGRTALWALLGPSDTLAGGAGVEVEIGGAPILRGADLRLRGRRAGGGGRAQRGRQVDAGAGRLRAAEDERPAASAGRAARSARCAAASWPGCAPSCRSGCRCRPGSRVREAVTIGRSSHLRPLRRLTGERPRGGSSAAMERAARHPLRRADADDALRRRAAAGPDRDRAGPGGAGADRRRADLPARPRRHDRRRRPAARARRRRPGGAAGRPRPRPGGGGRRHRGRRLGGAHGRHRAAGRGAERRAPGRGLGRRRAAHRARRPHRPARRLACRRTARVRAP